MRVVKNYRGDDRFRQRLFHVLVKRAEGLVRASLVNLIVRTLIGADDYSTDLVLAA